MMGCSPQPLERLPFDFGIDPHRAPIRATLDAEAVECVPSADPCPEGTVTPYRITMQSVGEEFERHSSLGEAAFSGLPLVGYLAGGGLHGADGTEQAVIEIGVWHGSEINCGAQTLIAGGFFATSNLTTANEFGNDRNATAEEVFTAAASVADTHEFLPLDDDDLVLGGHATDVCGTAK